MISTPAAWNPYQPVVRLDRRGTAFVVWSDNGGVFVAIRPAGAAKWLPTQTLSLNGFTGFALDANGNATILSGGGGAITVVDRPAGGNWSAPITVDNPPLAAPAGLAMADNGGAVAVWETYEKAPDPTDRTNYVVHAARRAAWGSPWGAPATLSTPLKQNYGHATAVAVDANGDAILAGRQLSDDPNLVLQAVTQSATGSWSSPVLVSEPGVDVGYPSVSVDAAGEATLAWASLGSGSSVVDVSTAVLPENAWTAPTQISPTNEVAGYPAVSGNRAGAAVVTWPGSGIPGGEMTKLEAAVRASFDRPWRTFLIGTAVNSLSNGVTGMDRAGSAVAVWNETPPSWIGQATKTSTYMP